MAITLQTMTLIRKEFYAIKRLDLVPGSIVLLKKLLLMKLTMKTLIPKKGHGVS